ncbi:hypothetical protein [Paraburkholderia sp. JPY419]|uniref:hypothetical protein n=1 Tax=Paraburkholderia sp. JPY419 TaxID=667660 RepID=UPI003D1D2CD2
MARLVAGFGSSHSIMLVCQREDWQHGFKQVDPKNPHYFDRLGNPTTYEALLKIAPTDSEAMVSAERMGERYDQAEAAMDEVRDRIRAAKLDVLLVVGDDQTETVSQDEQPRIRDLLWRDDPQREARGEPERELVCARSHDAPGARCRRALPR